jgi:hypothetical protein
VTFANPTKQLVESPSRINFFRKVEMIWCECCFPIHGEGCKATTTDDMGRQVCIFCADGFRCPRQNRIRKPTTNRAVRTTMEREQAVTVIAPESWKMDTETVTPQTCKVGDCDKKLGPRNRSGYCAVHRHLADPRRNSSRAEPGPNRSPTSATKNGLVTPPLSDKLAAERVNRLLINLPHEEKLQLCEAWLAGKI